MSVFLIPAERRESPSPKVKGTEAANWRDVESGREQLASMTASASEHPATSPMCRILIDLTDLERWSGTHGGTQRVVYNIAKHFYLGRDSLEYQLAFISFSNATKRFHFTVFDPIYERVEAPNRVSIGPDSSLRFSVTERLKRYLKRRVPERAKQPIRRVAVVVARVRTLIERYRRKDGIDPSEVVFSRQDIALILGKPWDNPNIQAALGIQRVEVGFRLVQVVYDLIICLYPHLHQPQLFERYRKNMLAAIGNSDLLFAISESSARDLRKFCKQNNLKEPDIKIIRLGDDIIDRRDKIELTRPDPRINARFIASVGTIEIRKNHMLLYYTYKLAGERNIDLPQLVIAGHRGWLTDDFQHLIGHDPAMREKIVMLHDISDTGVAWLYANCLFTVYPSIYEGWGLPIAESLAYGKLCISSNTSSMPEIGGSLVDYFSPYDPKECLEKLVLYLDDNLRYKKERDIKANYAQRTWQQTFSEILGYLSDR